MPAVPAVIRTPRQVTLEKLVTMLLDVDIGLAYLTEQLRQESEDALSYEHLWQLRMLGEPGVIEYDAAVRAALRGFVFDERGRRRVFAGADDDDDADDGAGADPAARARRAAPPSARPRRRARARGVDERARVRALQRGALDLSRPRSTRAISYVDVARRPASASRGVAIGADGIARETRGAPGRPSEDIPVGERWLGAAAVGEAAVSRGGRAARALGADLPCASMQAESARGLLT